jgi:serine/threonine protein kinase
MTAFGNYQLLGPLGKGGMAEIMLARSSGPNGFKRLIAIKRILPERAHDPDAVRMLFDEARNAARLAHHRIVQVFDMQLREGVVFFAMEYLHGQTLEAVLARAPKLPLAAAIAIGIAVADGLHYAHERALTHRDVAPANVMLTYDGNVKLIDFGIAKAVNNLSNTVFGTFKGRLGYSSPEQCECREVDRRTDVYSLGLVLYEMTTGRRAFTADSDHDMLQRMTDARVTPPRAIDPAYPAELEAIVMKALARDREQRYATAAELQHDLEAFARSAELNVSDLAMSRFMTEMFAAEVADLQRDARDTGMTLDEVFASKTIRERTGANLQTFDEWSLTLDSQPTLPRARRRTRRPRWLPPAIAAALFVAGYAVARWLMAG